MTNLLTAGSALIHSEGFADRCVLAAICVTREVVMEAASTPAHEQRMMLAQRVLMNPNMYRDAISMLMASDSNLATLGVPSGEEALATHEALLLEKLRQIWTRFAVALTS